MVEKVKEEEVETEEELELETLEVETQLVEAEVKEELTAFERERIAARQRTHEEEVRRYLASR